LFSNFANATNFEGKTCLNFPNSCFLYEFVNRDNSKLWHSKHIENNKERFFGFFVLPNMAGRVLLRMCTCVKTTVANCSFCRRRMMFWTMLLLRGACRQQYTRRKAQFTVTIMLCCRHADKIS